MASTVSGNDAADDALDLGAHQALDHRRQVGVEPVLQQRPHFLAHDVLDASGRRCAPASVRSAARVRTRLPTEDAAAAAASGATRPGVGGSSARRGAASAPVRRPSSAGGGTTGAGGGSGSGSAGSGTSTSSGQPSWRDRAPARRRPAGGAVGRAGAVPPAPRPRSGCGGSRRGCPPSRDRAVRCAAEVVGVSRHLRPRRLSGPAGWSRSRRDRPTCPSPHCSRRSRHTAAPADAGRARSAVRSPRRPDRTR